MTVAKHEDCSNAPHHRAAANRPDLKERRGRRLRVHVVVIVSKNKYEKEAKQARKANRRLRMCESKVAFESEEKAFQKNQKTYKCPHCGKWHRSGTFTTLVNTLQNRSR
jgi:nicotinic acid mononucleotide adenylyltransferase